MFRGDLLSTIRFNTWTAQDLSLHYVQRVPHISTTAMEPVGLINVQRVTGDQVVDDAELSLKYMESR